MVKNKLTPKRIVNLFNFIIFIRFMLIMMLPGQDHKDRMIRLFYGYRPIIWQVGSLNPTFFPVCKYCLWFLSLERKITILDTNDHILITKH